MSRKTTSNSRLRARKTERNRLRCNGRQTSLASKGIYVINAKNTPLIKIGISISPEERCKTFQTGNPHCLTVLYFDHFKKPRYWEKLIHETLEPIKQHGEWFTLTRGQIESLLDGLRTLKAMQNPTYEHNGFSYKRTGPDSYAKINQNGDTVEFISNPFLKVLDGHQQTSDSPAPGLNAEGQRDKRNATPAPWGRKPGAVENRERDKTCGSQVQAESGKRRGTLPQAASRRVAAYSQP